MLSMNAKIVVFVVVLCFISYSKSTEGDLDYYDEDDGTIEDCLYETDLKSLKKLAKLPLCDALENPSLKSATQLQIYVNHTEDKLRLRALSSASSTAKFNKSLITLTIDIIEDFKYPTSLLTIDDYQLIGPLTLRSMLLELANVNMNLLSRNLKKTLILAKNGHKQLLNCQGNVYPKQDVKALNITSELTQPISCSKEPSTDQFFTLQEKTFLHQTNKVNFRLVELHKDDAKKIARSTYYTCNNPVACTIGVQTKASLDKTVNYVLKFLQKPSAEKKKTASA